MINISIALENIRSLYNIGSIYRTAEFFGVKKIYLVGISAFDPYESDEINKKINKTSLGTYQKIKTERFRDIKDLIATLPVGTEIISFEQHKNSIKISDWKSSEKDILLIFGSETDGITKQALELSNKIIEIPRIGSHQSLNVEVTAGIALSFIPASWRRAGSYLKK